MTVYLPLHDITAPIARHVLWEFDSAGGDVGSYYSRDLVRLIVKADKHNRGLLERAYPGYVQAVRAIQYTETGARDLAAIASGGNARRTSGPALLEVDS